MDVGGCGWLGTWDVLTLRLTITGLDDVDLFLCSCHCSGVRQRSSHVTRHASRVTRHASHVTCDGHGAHDAGAKQPIPKHRLQLVPVSNVSNLIMHIAEGSAGLSLNLLVLVLLMLVVGGDLAAHRMGGEQNTGKKDV